VPKKNGELRMAIDYTQLNKVTVKEQEAIPTSEEIQRRLAGAEWFSKLDLKSGYYQVPIRVGDESKTAFVAQKGGVRYEFLRMPFGLTNAPMAFQRCMEGVLAGCQGVEVYLDDILIWGASKGEHDERLQKVLKKCREEGLTINVEKCQWGKQRIQYLGFELSREGIAQTDEMVAKIVGHTTPKTRVQLQSFLGLVNFYRRFVSGFAELAKSLTELLQKGRRFVWTSACEESFREIKKRLEGKRYMAFAMPGKPYTLTTDASDVGIGGVLEQEGKCVAIFSKTLTETERRYSTIERECLAVVKSASLL
jgi:hypothetical protein